MSSEQFWLRVLLLNDIVFGNTLGNLVGTDRPFGIDLVTLVLSVARSASLTVECG
jgi:hypothetical protein